MFICKLHFCILILAYAGLSMAATRMQQHSFPDQIQWFYDPENCQDSVLENTRKAFALWERLLPIETEYMGETTHAADDRTRNIVRCLLPQAFSEYATGHALTTLHSSEDSRLAFEIVYQATITGCELHEVSHALGLDHDPEEDPLISIMQGCNFSEYPTTEELQIMSSLYNSPVDCTPVLLSENTFFFPEFEGQWYRTKYTGSAWVIAAHGTNADDNFVCDLTSEGGRIQGSYFDMLQQKYFDLDIYENGEGWISSPE